MFLFIIDGEKLDFWGNKVGDIFVDSTIEKLNLPKDKTKVLYFLGLQEKPEFCKVVGNSVITQKKVISEVEIILEDGSKQIKIEESFVDDKTFAGELFFENGLIIKPC